MTTSDGVTLRHPPIPMVDVHPRLDIDTISILSSQSDSVQHLSSYIESDDEGKGLVGSNSSRLHEAIAQSSSLTSSSQHQPSAFKKDWAMYLTNQVMEIIINIDIRMKVQVIQVKVMMMNHHQVCPMMMKVNKILLMIHGQ